MSLFLDLRKHGKLAEKRNPMYEKSKFGKFWMYFMFVFWAGYTDEQKAINELHYCFVKYPEQMQGKFEDVKKALDHITENLDKGYREVNEIVDSVDKMGN